jgi:serine/threonine protein phosphatase PrpC
LGHTVETAKDGPEGVEKALASRPEVALIDIGLPGVDGYEVARRLRAALGGSIVLIAHTASINSRRTGHALLRPTSTPTWQSPPSWEYSPICSTKCEGGTAMLGKMDCHGLTDVGRVREVNEDQYLIADLSKSLRVHSTSLGLDDQTRLFGSSQGNLLLVADGMGGHAAGRRASTLAVNSLTTYVLNTMHWFFRVRTDSEEYFEADLKAALEHCQARVQAEGERIPERRGMGTTLTMAYLSWPRLYVVHAGDSRCYLFRRTRLRQITRDHAVAQQLMEKGLLGDKDMESSQWSHVLWNVIGGDSDELSPEVFKAELALGDKLLLCTDGLTKHVAERDIATVLGSDATAEGSCRRLVDAANAAGGSDNVTVIVAQFCDHEDVRARAEEAARALEAPQRASDVEALAAEALTVESAGKVYSTAKNNRAPSRSGNAPDTWPSCRTAALGLCFDM